MYARKMKLCFLFVALASLSVQGFAPSRSFSRSATVLKDIIAAQEVDEKPDPELIELEKKIDKDEEAIQNSAIKLWGAVKHGPGKAIPERKRWNELLTFSKVHEVDDATVKDVMAKAGMTLITTGIGTELYKDPGETTLCEITLAPDDAVRDALMGAGSVSESQVLYINFLGGKDLIIGQVMNAVEELVLDLSPPTKAKIYFNSLCHGSFPLESCTVTVLSKSSDSSSDETEGMKGVEKSVANGEVYFRDGKWWTVDEADIFTTKH